MASVVLRSYIQEKAYSLLGILCLFVLVQRANATNFMVGGSGNWKVPSDPSSNSYNPWAEKTRFQIGDSLVFNYQANQDSVLLVTKENYDSCNTDSPLASFSDGHTSYKFNKSGHFYFISGNKDHCKKNEKLLVIVMSDRSSKNQPPSSSPPAPTPQAASPSPAPGSVEMNPTPAPVSEPPPHPSAAPGTVYLSLLGSFGPFLASALVLVC